VKAMIEIVDPGALKQPRQGYSKDFSRGRHTLELHTEGGGDPESLLARMTHPGGTVCMFIDKDDARMLFNRLGMWLHDVPIR